MLKIKAKFDQKTNNFEFDQSARNTNFYEYYGTLCALIDVTLKEIKIFEKELIEMIKNRNKYTEQKQFKKEGEK